MITINIRISPSMIFTEKNLASLAFVLLTVHHLGRGLSIELAIHLFTARFTGLLWVSIPIVV